ncbi:MAG: riboflavin kinase [Candidatus Gracilibacteria bacterium]
MKLTGKIVHGQGRGKALGFPTLNIEGDFVDLEQGVYAVWVDFGQGRFRGAMNYGPQPTFEGMQTRAEVFVLDFEGDLYGETAEITVVKKTREVQKFDSATALQEQIQKDVGLVRGLLYNDPT